MDEKKNNIHRLLTVLIPFSLCYFLGMMVRNVNAVLAPQLSKELHISLAALGFMSSLFLFFFATSQIPLGALLDTHQPKRVQSWLCLLSALGLGVFGSAHTLWGLSVGRAMMGVGTALILNAGLKSFNYWFEKRHLPIINSILQSAGGVGALVATFPTAELIEKITWRGVCLVFSLLFVMAVLLLVFVAPKQNHPETEHTFSWSSLFKYGDIIKNKEFWHLIIPGTICFGTFTALQSLWIGPWLNLGLGFSSERTATFLLVIALAMIIGMLSGHLFFKFSRALKKSARWGQLLFLSLFLLFFLGCTIEPFSTNIVSWIGFGYFAQSLYMIFPLVSEKFDHGQFGRVSSMIAVIGFGWSFLIQLIMGFVIETWEPQKGEYPEIAYQSALWLALLACALAVTWGYITYRKENHEPQ